MLCYFLLHRKVNQPYTYIHPLFGFPSHLGHCRALSGVPQCVYTHTYALLSQFVPLSSSPPSSCSHVYFQPLCLYSRPANRFISTIFLDSIHVDLPDAGIEPASLMSLDWKAGSLPQVPPGKPSALIYNIFLFLTDFTLYGNLQVLPHLHKGSNVTHFHDRVINIPLYIGTTSLSIPLLMNIQVASIIWLLEIVLQ